MTMDRVFINPPDTPAMAVIHAVIDAQRLGNKLANQYAELEL